MSASEPARQNGLTSADARQNETRRWYSKTHANYWKARLEHRSYSRDDRNFEVAEWSVRIYFKGVRKSFDLETANKEEAAAKARDIYVSLVTKGWAATIAELTPQVMSPINPADGSPRWSGHRISNPKRFGVTASIFGCWRHKSRDLARTLRVTIITAVA
jgi:hypothetical protein